MSPGPAPTDSPFDGDPVAEPSLEDALIAVRALAGARFEVLGPLGRDREGGFAFLARDLSAGRLVVLKRRAQAPGDLGPAALRVIDRLDASVPPPAGACPVCRAPFVSWDPSCPDCGADLAGSIGTPDQGSSREELLAAVREAAPGYEVLGEMPRAAGGANVYFAREHQGGTLVALRLEQEDAPGRGAGFTVAATRMMRPKLLYGTVGGDSRESGGPSGGGSPAWTPVPSPPASRPRIGATPSGAPQPFTAGAALEKICPQCGETFGPELRFCPKDGSGLRAKAPSEAGDLVGQVIAERYHILAKLGEGGMGRVYLAEHVRMGRRCAVKVMNPILLYDPDSVSRFNREAANASRITHPNVAAIYDFGESDDVVYLAMEFVEGESLAALLEREHALPEPRAISIGLQVADALSAAHELGIVHRDLKPDNIMVTRSRDGRDVVKVVDFGIAKATKGERQTVTRKGFVVGTPAYMSPEQILGDLLDGRSDLYSLGCILYEMLTGVRAFADSSGEVSIRQRLTESPPPPGRVKSGLSAKLDALVTTAMARAPEQRFQSAAQLRDALSAAAREAPAKPSWIDRLPWRRAREATPAPTASLPTGRPGVPPAISLPAAAQAGPPTPAAAAQSPGTAPVPLGWEEAAPPVLQRPGRGTTMLRHRSARPARWHPGWLAGAGAVAAVVAFGAWMLFSPPRSADQRPQVETKIVLPKPEAPVPPSEPVVDSAPATGTVRFVDPLPFGAKVTVDGTEASPSSDGSLSLSPGRHLVRVEAPGYRPTSHTAGVESGQTTVVAARLVRSDPPSAPTARPEPPPPAATTRTPAARTAAPEPVVAVVVSPPVLDLATGETRTLLAVPQNSRGLPLSGKETAWESDDTSIVRVEPSGRAVGVREGRTTVRATVEGRSAEATVRVTPPVPVVIALHVVRGDTVLRVGDRLQLTALARDDAGKSTLTAASWESKQPAVASVEPRGELTAMAEGRAVVVAESQGMRDSMLIRVVQAPPAEETPSRVSDAPPDGATMLATAAACAAAIGSGDELQIVGVYQARTGQDIKNLRKLLDIALRKEWGLTAAAVGAPRGQPTGVGRFELNLTMLLKWRNGAGAGKKKEAPFRIEMLRNGSQWKMQSCRATGTLDL
jgi:eukaryotic-like serine/threonine-protein kinase